MFLYFYENEYGIKLGDEVYEQYPHLEKNLSGFCELKHSSPSGHRGIVFSQSETDVKIGFYPEEQTWTKCGCLWVGYCEKPTPDKLLRKDRPFDGYELKLKDGNAWRVVIARDFVKGEVFPKEMILNDIGDWVEGETLKEFVRYSMIAKKFEELLKISPELIVIDDIDNNEIMNSACELLGCLYNIGKFEVNILSLLDLRLAKEIIGLALDSPMIRAFMSDPEMNKDLKKKGILQEQEIEETDTDQH